jgi:hypothetical protein
MLLLNKMALPKMVSQVSTNHGLPKNLKQGIPNLVVSSSGSASEALCSALTSVLAINVYPNGKSKIRVPEGLRELPSDWVALAGTRTGFSLAGICFRARPNPAILFWHSLIWLRLRNLGDF